MTRRPRTIPALNHLAPPWMQRVAARERREAIERSLDAMAAMARGGRVGQKRWQRDRPAGTLCHHTLVRHFGTWSAVVEAAVGRSVPLMGMASVDPEPVIAIIARTAEARGLTIGALARQTFPDPRDAHSAHRRWLHWRAGTRRPTPEYARADLLAIGAARTRP